MLVHSIRSVASWREKMGNEPPVLAVSRTAFMETARKFQNLSDDFKGLMPISGFPALDTGSADLDAALDTFLRMLGELHLVVAQAINNHGVKLGTAADNFSNTEFTISKAIKQVITEEKVTSPDPLKPID
ncbi:DUF6317 family protein [Actinoallomurus acaciae]|uniref:DUF6317 family protein n=1 Tax=Actinoallomurus acaciae TaxID=502577 RepID=A0ABV5YKR8_9ACTN